MKISVKEFAMTAKFGPIEVGMQKEQVIKLLGIPESDDRRSMGHTEIIYSMYEFFFDENQTLYALQNDSFNTTYPEKTEFKNDRFEVDPWILRAKEPKTFSEIGNVLEKEKINHRIIEYFGRNVIELDSRVVIDFEDEGTDPGLVGLRYWPNET